MHVVYRIDGCAIGRMYSSESIICNGAPGLSSCRVGITYSAAYLQYLGRYVVSPEPSTYSSPSPQEDIWTAAGYNQTPARGAGSAAGGPTAVLGALAKVPMYPHPTLPRCEPPDVYC